MVRRTLITLAALTCSLSACSMQRNRTPIVSLLGNRLAPLPPSPNRDQLEHNLEAARQHLSDDPTDPARIVWVGRRLGYLWRMREAIDVFTTGIEQHPNYAPFYRHRGHRYISIRRFDDAIADLKKAAELIEDVPDEIEQDGMPNDRNIPLTTTGFNVWYHLGLARYLTGDFEGALAAYRETDKFTRGYDDNIVAVTDWTYMILRRLNRPSEARAVLGRITPDMKIIENDAYHRRCLMYKGLIAPSDLLDVSDPSALTSATLGYGLGNWYLCEGNESKAVELFERITSGTDWPAFGFIAAEADLARR